MRSRCKNDPDSPSFKYYYGKGVRICERWLNLDYGFINFLADLGKRPPGKSLDRIDVDGHYEPSNCRWATDKQQANNKTTSPEYLARMLELDKMRDVSDDCAEVLEFV